MNLSVSTFHSLTCDLCISAMSSRRAVSLFRPSRETSHVTKVLASAATFASSPSVERSLKKSAGTWTESFGLSSFIVRESYHGLDTTKGEVRRPSFVPKDIDRKNARCSPRGDQRGGDANRERGGGDPYGVERVGLKWNERDGINLRVKRDQA